MVLDCKCLQEYPVHARVPQDFILRPTLFLLYINDLPDNVTCNIEIYAHDSTLYSKCELLAHRRDVASLSLFYKYYFGRCSSELAKLVPLPFSRGLSTRYSDGLNDFLVTIPRCYKAVYVNTFFFWAARLWNSLPIECFSFPPRSRRFKTLFLLELNDLLLTR